MKIKIIKNTKPALDVKDLIKEYEKRLTLWTKVESIIIKKDEDLLNYIDSYTYLICLDEHGIECTSMELAKKLQLLTNEGRLKSVVFYIGGSYGIFSSILDKANLKLSLSKLTFQGDLAWLLLWEQVYRAYSIINNSSYHHE